MNKNIISTTGIALAAGFFIAITILVNTIFTSWRLDLTESKLFTLSEGTVNILRNLEEPVRLDLYFSQKSMVGYPNLMNYGIRVRDMLLEYEAHSNGRLDLNIIDPEVFSEEEDQAVASGLKSVPLNNSGDRAYFGLVGTSSTDDEKVIPFFNLQRESALEYDITKLIFGLSHPQKRVVGIMSSLPVYGDPNEGTSKWVVIKTIEEFFTVRNLGEQSTNLNGIDVLMIIHPKDLKDEILFAIDQFLLKGGKAMIFVDPLAEGDNTQAEDQNSAVLPDVDSDLNKLTDMWGATVVKDKVVSDINAAMRVQARSPTGVQEVTYLPWLKLAKESFNQSDFATSQINVIHMGTAGIITKKEDSDEDEKEYSGIEFIPLIETSKQSMQIERDFIQIQRDPNALLRNFKSENKKQILAARIVGHVKTAFPEGLSDEGDGEGKPKEQSDTVISEGDINVIITADTDILRDIFWVRKQSFLGIEIPQTIANNGDFVVNALENLSGSNDLASLRTRREYTRPFEKVESIRNQAELEYRESEQNLLQTLRETEQKIQAIQQQKSGGEEESKLLLTSKQNEEIKKYQQLRIDTRKKLRAVRHGLKKDIESLGNLLRFINILLLPLIIVMVFIATGIYRMIRKGAH